MKEVDEFLGDGIQFIEGEFFEFVKDGRVGDDCDVEGVGDGCRQDARIYWVRP